MKLICSALLVVLVSINPTQAKLLHSGDDFWEVASVAIRASAGIWWTAQEVDLDDAGLSGYLDADKPEDYVVVPGGGRPSALVFPLSLDKDYCIAAFHGRKICTDVPSCEDTANDEAQQVKASGQKAVQIGVGATDNPTGVEGDDYCYFNHQLLGHYRSFDDPNTGTKRINGKVVERDIYSAIDTCMTNCVANGGNDCTLIAAGHSQGYVTAQAVAIYFKTTYETTVIGFGGPPALRGSTCNILGDRKHRVYNFINMCKWDNYKKMVFDPIPFFKWNDDIFKSGDHASYTRFLLMGDDSRNVKHFGAQGWINDADNTGNDNIITFPTNFINDLGAEVSARERRALECHFMSDYKRKIGDLFTQSQPNPSSVGFGGAREDHTCGTNAMCQSNICQKISNQGSKYNCDV